MLRMWHRRHPLFRCIAGIELSLTLDGQPTHEKLRRLERLGASQSEMAEEDSSILPARISASSAGSLRTSGRTPFKPSSTRFAAHLCARTNDSARKTDLPCLSAASACDLAPDVAPASITRVTSARPDIVLLRRRKSHGAVTLDGRYSLTSDPPLATMSSANPRCAAGYRRVIGVPITATVLPPALSAARCAAASIPIASPEKMTRSFSTSARTARSARRSPSLEALRVPTTATPGPSIALWLPCQNRMGGASAICSNCAG